MASFPKSKTDLARTSVIILAVFLKICTSQPFNMPRCAFGCMTSLAPQTSCDTGDFPCFCGNSTNLGLLEACVSANCTSGGGGGNFGGFGQGFGIENICSQLGDGGGTTAVAGGPFPTTTSGGGQTASMSSSDSASGSSGRAVGTSEAQAMTETITVDTTITTAESTSITPPPFATHNVDPAASSRKSNAGIIGGVIGGILALIIVAAVAVHAIRKKRRRKRKLQQLMLDGGRGGAGSASEINNIAGTGIDENSQSIWSGGPVVSFILDGRRRGTAASQGSRWGDH